MSFSISVNEVDAICVSGNVDFSNVELAKEKGQNLMDSLGKVRIDLSGMQPSDSSSLALMVAWVRAASHRDKAISFCNVPNYLWDLSRVSGLDAILPIEG